MKKYQIKNAIGSGNFSTVYCAEDQDDHQTYAVKVMKTHPRIATREAYFLNKLKHPNVIDLIQFEQNQDQSKLVFEYVGINTLELYEAHSYGLRQEQVKCILFQTALGLAYIHSFGIIHRDIKPQNLLIDKKNALVKIIDFGLAITQQKISTDYIATRWYRAPENLLATKEYTTAIDVFSLGCVIVELYLGSPLFPGSNNMDQLYKIFNILGEPTILNWSAGYKKMIELGIKTNSKSQIDIDLNSILNPCDHKLIDLIKKMLILNPRDRITCESIVKHEYFKDIRSIIPPLVYKRYEEDFLKVNNDPLSFRGFHQMKNPKMSIKDTVKAIGIQKTKPGFHSFRSQEPSRKDKSESIDSVQSYSQHKRINPSIIKSVGAQMNEDLITRNRYITNANQKSLLAHQKSSEKIIKNGSIINNISIDSKEQSQLLNDLQNMKYYSKNSTGDTSYQRNERYGISKMEKPKQSIEIKANKVQDIKTKAIERNRIGKSPNEIQKSNNFGLRSDRSPKYLEQIKNLQAPKMVRIQENRNVQVKNHPNISPMNSYRLEQKRNIEDRYKHPNFHSPSRQAPITNDQKKQKYSLLRNSDQGKRINLSPNSYNAPKLNVGANQGSYRPTLLNSYSSTDNLSKAIQHQSYLRKSPEITSKNYPTHFNSFQNKNRY